MEINRHGISPLNVRNHFLLCQYVFSVFMPENLSTAVLREVSEKMRQKCVSFKLL